ncbi:ABC transporter permease [Petroclostridium sp. X23]|uniref:ABC transporter permease n=1 Tax=Petroclostridium sp. X23 TaxID=3045146 RepID=UPI0024AD0FC6|nr:ABC transporter permease [Petroclostridium sp. X23]WHH61780.1 ABC transporter permease [Petroclostridium sp. X23]
MDSKQNNLKQSGNNIFFGLLWIVFAFIILFLLLLIIGLLTYSDFHTLFDILKQPEFHFALKFTLWTSILATILATIFALPCGYILSRYKLPGSIFLDTILDMPIVLPPLISGIALLIFFGPFLGEHLARAGINIVFTPLGVIVAQWFIATPYAIKTFKQAFTAIDQRMEKVARTLGFSPFRVFFRVTLPLAKNGLISGIMMAWTRALGEFGATAMLAGITRMKTETLSVAVFLNMSIGDIKFAISTAIVMLFIALMLLIVLKMVLRNEVRV